MFGRHVAELRQSSRERIDNPLINMREFYHRSVDLANKVTDTFFKEFQIPNFDPKKNTYMPITVLKNNSIPEVVASFGKLIPDLQLISKEPHSIAVLVIPKYEDGVREELSNQLKEKMRNLGLVVSSWEIAENVRTAKIPEGLDDFKITLDPDLPKTIEAFLQSDIMRSLDLIVHSETQCPTKMLAKCLQKMLHDLPELNPKATQRIALMLDLTNTFYSQNYPRYAFCVYTIIHEISLALIQQKNQATLAKEFKRFHDESFSALTSALDLDKDKLDKSSFVAVPSISGVSACAVAMKIASKMHKQDGKEPKIKIFKPCYYELHNISNLDAARATADADICMISAGPIVNPEGLTPGVDINLFMRRHVIKANRSKPLVIVVDSTTALYKNMKLDDDIKKLVEEGKISIIVHESHQKFGLIHTDQAQYGRVFGWCSKEHFSEAELEMIKQNSQDDFDAHVDLRIGAFISTRCQKILEDIKEQHFSNGAILRNILMQTALIEKEVVTHEDMLQNLNELYFLNNNELSPGSSTSRLEKAAYGVIDRRSSFGHYSPTTAGVMAQRRMSPDASDDLDCLVQAAHIRLALEQSGKTMLWNLMHTARDKAELSLEEQIVVTGMLHHITSNVPLIPTNIKNINYISGQPTPKDLHALHAPNSMLFIDNPGKKLKIAYYSHDNLLVERSIDDAKITKMVRAKKFTSHDDRTHINKYLQILQRASLPQNVNVATFFAAASNALECCPLLKKRQYTLKNKKWLKVLREKVLEQNQPIEPTLFLKTVRYLYDLHIPLKENQLSMLAKHPELCILVQNYQDVEAIKCMLLIKEILGASVDCSKALKNKEFLVAVLKIDEVNEDILNGLKPAEEKYNKAMINSKKYLNVCYRSLLDFYTKPKPDHHAREHLLRSFKKAEVSYQEILDKDRSTTSKALRYILKGITNFIASLTFGYAHYKHYQETGDVAFFSGTTSARKLKKLHHELCQPANRY